MEPMAFEHTVKEHGHRLTRVETDLQDLRVSHAKARTLQEANFKQIMSSLDRLENRKSPNGWQGAMKNPQTLIIILAFLASALGLEIIWPAL